MKYSDISPDFVDYLITDKDSIRNAIKNIILIRKYSLLGDTKIGSRVMNIIFSSLDELSIALYTNEIKTVLNNKEPRIEVLDIILQATDNNEVFCDISYKILDSLIDSVESIRLNLNK